MPKCVIRPDGCRAPRGSFDANAGRPGPKGPTVPLRARGRTPARTLPSPQWPWPPGPEPGVAFGPGPAWVCSWVWVCAWVCLGLGLRRRRLGLLPCLGLGAARGASRLGGGYCVVGAVAT
jgi:hypothetical protein